MHETLKQNSHLWSFILANNTITNATVKISTAKRRNKVPQDIFFFFFLLSSYSSISSFGSSVVVTTELRWLDHRPPLPPYLTLSCNPRSGLKILGMKTSKPFKLELKKLRARLFLFLTPAWPLWSGFSNSEAVKTLDDGECGLLLLLLTDGLSLLKSIESMGEDGSSIALVSLLLETVRSDEG